MSLMVCEFSGGWVVLTSTSLKPTLLNSHQRPEHFNNLSLFNGFICWVEAMAATTSMSKHHWNQWKPFLNSVISFLWNLIKIMKFSFPKMFFKILSAMTSHLDQEKMVTISQTTLSNAFLMNFFIWIKIQLKFDPKCAINNIPALVQIMA